MIFLAVLSTFFIESFDVTVVTCDADWMDSRALEQMLTAELSELSDEDRRGMIAAVDQCSDTSVRIRVNMPNKGRERAISIGEVEPEARMRTIALALGELARETDIPPVSPDAVSPLNKCEEKTTSPPATPASDKMDASNAQADDDEKIPFVPKTKTSHQWSIGVFARGFPLAKTVAPEARLGLHFSRWRVSIGGYGMGWTSSLGTAYLAAFTLMGGPTLWQYDGRISAVLDLLMELGAVVAFGKADAGSDYTPKFNIAAGSHLAFRIGPNPKVRFRPMFTIEAGWLRGLNLYAADTFLGGFEGLSLSGGVLALF
jgi:hypothetical protein